MSRPETLLSVQPLKAHGSLPRRRVGALKRTQELFAPDAKPSGGVMRPGQGPSPGSEQRDCENAAFLPALARVCRLQRLGGSAMLTAFIFSMLW